MRTLVGSLLLCGAALALPASAQVTPDPLLLQRQGIARVDAYVDHMRKTGDQVSRRSELVRAEQELFASYGALRSRGDMAGALLSAVRFGDAKRLQDQLDAAMAVYRETERLARQADLPELVAKALMGQVKIEFLNRKNLGAALALAEAAERVSAPIADRKYLFEALNYRGSILVAQGDLIGGGDALNRALTMAESLDDQGQLAFAYLDRGEVYQKLGEKCDYQRTFAPCYEALTLARKDFERALTIFQGLGWAGVVRPTRDLLQGLELRRKLIETQEAAHGAFLKSRIFKPKKVGDVLVTEKFLEGGHGGAQELLAAAQQAGIGAGGGDARGVHTQGLLHDMQGEHDKALAFYLRAVDLLEADRRNLTDEKSRGTFLENKIEMYYWPVLQLLERRRYAEAFELLERSRSRALADLMASREIELGSPRARAAYGEAVTLRTRLAALQTELLEHRNRPDRARYADTIARLEADIRRLEEELRAVVGRLTSESPRAQTLVVSQPATLAQVQQSARRDGHEVLYYLVRDTGMVVWLIGADAVTVRSVFLPRSELGKKVELLRRSLADGKASFDAETSRELYLFLVAPMQPFMKTGHLVIVPHEDLHYLPFQALQNPEDGSYLGERLQLSYAPSATVLLGSRKVRQIAGETLLAVADPGLPAAVDEVEALARLYPGRGKIVTDVLASETDVRAWAGQHPLVHLSVHGVFSPQAPLLSHLKLRRDAQHDGQLTAAEMFGLPLDRVTLLVLSACETGRAEATHANEVLGMQRALLYAGANTLVLSSWKVDAKSTELWMTTFYREAQGKPLSEAARAALRAVKQHPSYGHPYHWAAFSMIGR
jgi:CHAT domain-containing protein